jgi:type I restriction enzyme, S subunit
MNKEMMQESGVEWIGAIPQGWRIDRLKDIANINENSLDAKTPDDYLLKYIEISNVNSRGIISEQAIEEIEFSTAPSRAKRKVFSGDTIISSVRPNLQAIAYIELDELNLVCSTGFYVVKPKYQHLFDNKFIYYFLLSENSKQYFESVAKGVGYPAVDDKDFKSLYSTLPPLAEQQAIAQYLDQRCGKLDAIIAIKQQQIKTLDALRQSIIYHAVTKGLDDSVPFVDSGVEWLGKIPQGWKVSKLRYEISIKNGDFISNKLDDESEYPVVGGNGFMGRTDDFNVKGDIIVIGRVGAYCGNVHYINEKSWISDNALIVDTGNNKRFFTYLLNAFNLNSIANKTAQPVVTATNIKAIYIPKPLLPEQQSIVDHLDQETQSLNDLKENLSQQISTLEAYKKALIYECVTGKKRIRAENLKAG